MAGALPHGGRARSILVTPTPDVFPLKISANGRHFVDGRGRPFIGFGDTAWQIVTDCDSSDLETYFADRQSRGFNLLITQATSPVKYVSGSVAPGARGASNALPYLLNTTGGTWDGDPTFTHFDADFSSPNSVYWDWCDYVLDRARIYGFAVVIDPIYYGFNLGAGDGWYQTIGNSVNTQAVCFAHGQYVGARWRKHPNLILSMGTDTFPATGTETSARIAKFQDGLISAGCVFPTLAHYQRSSGSLDYPDFASYMTVRGCYTGTDNGSAFACNYARLRQEFAASPTMPVICVESNYEPLRTRTQLRTLAWQAMLSSIAGYSGYANNPVASFNRTIDTLNVPGVAFPWQSYLGSDGTLDLQMLWAFVRARTSWHLLEPRGLGSAGTLVTAGGGTLQTMGTANPTSNATATHDNTDGQDYVTAAVATDGSLMVAYFPPANGTTSATFDASKMRGTVTPRWFDPTTGIYTSAGATFANTGTQVFAPSANAAGDPDQVLIFEA